MELWQLLLIIGTLFATLTAFIWVALRVSSIGKVNNQPRNLAGEAVSEAVNQAFTDDFREELRQRARQQFEKLIHENAMFLQQDVRMSAAQLDDFMKKQIFATLQQELVKHHESVTQTRQMLSDSVAKSQVDLQTQLKAEKERRIELLDRQLTEIIKKYVSSAVGDIITTDQQIALIVDNLNAHKNEIIEDIRNV